MPPIVEMRYLSVNPCPNSRPTPLAFNAQVLGSVQYLLCGLTVYSALCVGDGPVNRAIRQAREVNRHRRIGVVIVRKVSAVHGLAVACGDGLSLSLDRSQAIYDLERLRFLRSRLDHPHKVRVDACKLVVRV